MTWPSALTPSAAERAALAGAALILVVQALEVLHPTLAYRSALAWTQPWRLLSAHFVHLNWTHAAINAAAWVVVARLFWLELVPVRQGVVIFISALVVSAALALMWPSIDGYRGFSGVLHALYFHGASAWLCGSMRDPKRRNVRELWLPIALWIGGVVKVVAEQPWDASLPYAEWLGGYTVPQAHLIGAVVGLWSGLLGGLWSASWLAARANASTKKNAGRLAPPGV